MSISQPRKTCQHCGVDEGAIHEPWCQGIGHFGNPDAPAAPNTGGDAQAAIEDGFLPFQEAGPCRMYLCLTALRQAAQMIKQPSHIYALNVHPLDAHWVGHMLQKMACTTADNPFAPYVNVVPNDKLPPHAWFVSNGHGERYGSNPA